MGISYCQIGVQMNSSSEPYFYIIQQPVSMQETGQYYQLAADNNGFQFLVYNENGTSGGRIIWSLKY